MTDNIPPGPENGSMDASCTCEGSSACPGRPSRAGQHAGLGPGQDGKGWRTLGFEVLMAGHAGSSPQRGRSGQR
jgi:hypothetical protein